MILPSKELLSEILDIEEGYIELARCDKDSTICYQHTRNANTEDESIEYHFVNIYELAHRVKEWAYDEHNFIISSEYENTIDGKLCRAKCGKKVKFNERVNWVMSVCKKTEPEAVFQAGEWILGKLNG